MACRRSGVRAPVAPPNPRVTPSIRVTIREHMAPTTDQIGRSSADLALTVVAGARRACATQNPDPSLPPTPYRDPRKGHAMRSEQPYNPSELEPRWQARWEELGLHTADLSDDGDSRPKFYLLTMYSYPSGDLHIGHW